MMTKFINMGFTKQFIGLLNLYHRKSWIDINNKYIYDRLRLSSILMKTILMSILNDWRKCSKQSIYKENAWRIHVLDAWRRIVNLFETSSHSRHSSSSIGAIVLLRTMERKNYKKDNQQSFSRLHQQSFSRLHTLKKDYRESFSGLLNPPSLSVSHMVHPQAYCIDTCLI